MVSPAIVGFGHTPQLPGKLLWKVYVENILLHRIRQVEILFQGDPHKEFMRMILLLTKSREIRLKTIRIMVG